LSTRVIGGSWIAESMILKNARLLLNPENNNDSLLSINTPYLNPAIENVFIGDMQSVLCFVKVTA